MRTLSLDLRQRILASYDEGKQTREDVAKRFRVSLGMVKKLLCQRQRLQGDIAPQHHRVGRKPKILARHREAMQVRLGKKPDLTLKELRAALKLECSLPAIHYALQDLGLTYKKRLSGPASRTAPTSPEPGKPGRRDKPGSIPRG